jgi:hypothetical protein
MKITVIKTIRTQKTFDKYLKFFKKESFKYKCVLCREKSIKEFKYWRIFKTRFPLDKIAKVDHILITKRHIPINKINAQEEEEFKLIRMNYLSKKYDAMLEGLKTQSVPEHHHLHLLVFKR